MLRYSTCSKEKAALPVCIELLHLQVLLPKTRHSSAKQTGAGLHVAVSDTTGSASNYRQMGRASVRRPSAMQQPRRPACDAFAYHCSCNCVRCGTSAELRSAHANSLLATVSQMKAAACARILGGTHKRQATPQPSNQCRKGFITHERLSMLHVPTVLTLPLVTSCNLQESRQDHKGQSSAHLGHAGAQEGVLHVGRTALEHDQRDDEVLHLLPCCQVGDMLPYVHCNLHQVLQEVLLQPTDGAPCCRQES